MHYAAHLPLGEAYVGPMGSCLIKCLAKGGQLSFMDSVQDFQRMVYFVFCQRFSESIFSKTWKVIYFPQIFI